MAYFTGKSGKRPLLPVQTHQGASKKRKLATRKPRGAEYHRPARKTTASDKDVIPIPIQGHDVELSDQDFDVVGEYGDAASFLNSLDYQGIARSKQETDRLHRLNKPVRKPRLVDDLPSIDSGDDEEASWSSNLETDADSESDVATTSSLDGTRKIPDDIDSDTEMPYEAVPRKRRPSWDSVQNDGIPHLPIKLPDGRVQKVEYNGTTPSSTVKTNFDEDEEEHSDTSGANEPAVVEDISTGARFGRPAVVDLIRNSSRKARIQGAREEIALICQSIVAEPESSLGLLRRLHAFSLPKISTPSHPDPVVNDVIIRKLTILSQLAVFKDVIPGYRIRPQTDMEKSEKVSQQVARTREWEQGLVAVYQSYLRALEAEVKAKSELADVALRCICNLAAEVTHFNFSVNLMNAIVAHLSRRSWDKSSEMCLDTIIRIFRSDLTGESSLEIVRLLNRMIKEKQFQIQPKVLSCLVHLRLKTELKTHTPETKMDKAVTKSHSKGKAAARRAKGKPTHQPHASKKARKAMTEEKEIDRELREAEAEVDKEERDVRQTETLKLLFVLYFRILKNPIPTPLLPAALQGISKFAHLVNIDFFEDLMKVLKNLISRDSDTIPEKPKRGMDVQHRLLCIVTAFELLSGQGEALNIDLTDFIAELYAIIMPLGLICSTDSQFRAIEAGSEKPESVVEILFRTLTIAFAPRTLGSSPSPWRSAAFAKRILLSALQWPPDFALQALDFVAGLIARESKLEALLSTDERVCDGHYRVDVDDPQLSNPFGASFWELHILRRHWHPQVREAAGKLARFAHS